MEGGIAGHMTEYVPKHDGMRVCLQCEDHRPELCWKSVSPLHPCVYSRCLSDAHRGKHITCCRIPDLHITAYAQLNT